MTCAVRFLPLSVPRNGPHSCYTKSIGLRNLLPQTLAFISEEAAKMREKNYEVLGFGITHNCQTHFDLARDLAQSSEHRQYSTGLAWHLFDVASSRRSVDNSRREPSHGAVSTMAASGSVGVMAPQQEQQRQQDPESLMPMSDDASRSAILCKTIGRRRMRSSC